MVQTHSGLDANETDSEMAKDAAARPAGSKSRQRCEAREQASEIQPAAGGDLGEPHAREQQTAADSPTAELTAHLVRTLSVFVFCRFAVSTPVCWRGGGPSHGCARRRRKRVGGEGGHRVS